jgi:hypothetical protein
MLYHHPIQRHLLQPTSVGTMMMGWCRLIGVDRFTDGGYFRIMNTDIAIAIVIAVRTTCTVDGIRFVERIVIITIIIDLA